MTTPAPIEAGARADITRTTRVVSHEEAKEIALRLIRGSFRRDGERLPADKRPNFSIPTRVNDDDDCLMIAYIEQQAAIATGSLVPASAVADMRERCAKVICDTICKMDWPPDDGDRLIDELQDAIRALDLSR